MHRRWPASRTIEILQEAGANKLMKEACAIEQAAYDIYPSPLPSPYRDSRFKVGEDMYATLGIERDGSRSLLNGTGVRLQSIRGVDDGREAVSESQGLQHRKLLDGFGFHRVTRVARGPVLSWRHVWVARRPPMVATSAETGGRPARVARISIHKDR